MLFYRVKKEQGIKITVLLYQSERPCHRNSFYCLLSTVIQCKCEYLSFIAIQLLDIYPMPCVVLRIPVKGEILYPI